MCACKKHSNPFADCTCICDHDKLVADLLKPLLKNYTGKAIIKAFPQHVWDELENMYRLKPKMDPFEDEDHSSLLEYAEPLFKDTLCKEDCTNYPLGDACKTCGHASALHPGVHNPGLDTCVVCNAQEKSDLNPEQEARATALYHAKQVGGSALSLLPLARWIYEGKQPRDK